MGEDEKALQIGRAVAEYQSAKVECAHIDQRIDTVFLAYREAGRTMDRHNGTPSEPQLVNGKVKFGWYGKASASDILNENDLAELLAERDKARVRLKVAKDIMTNLGITSVS